MPELSALPKGTRVFVDTNIFDYHFQGVSKECTEFLRRVALGEIPAYVNTQVLSDLIHKLMLAEAVSKGIINRRLASHLKTELQRNRAVAANLVDYHVQFEEVLKMGVRVLPIDRKMLIETKFERVQYSLMTGDSLHIGSMNRCQINRRLEPLKHIVTRDGDFAHIPELTIWEPTDITGNATP